MNIMDIIGYCNGQSELEPSVEDELCQLRTHVETGALNHCEINEDERDFIGAVMVWVATKPSYRPSGAISEAIRVLNLKLRACVRVGVRQQQTSPNRSSSSLGNPTTS